MRTKTRKKQLKPKDNGTKNSPAPSNLPRLFLLIGGFFGLVMLFLTPPFQVPDEHDHFFRTVMISSGQFVAKSYPFSETERQKAPPKYLKGKGGVVPVSIPYTTRKVNHKLPFHPENKQQLSDLKEMLMLPLHMKGMTEVFINTSAGGYAPPLYLPAALTIAVGKSFNLSALRLMYLGRLANLMVFLSLIYWALRITPTGKKVIFLLALMPMTLFLAPSLSIDGLIIASSILLVSALLNLARNDKSEVERQFWIIIPLTLTIIALGKVVYCPLILLFFISPKNLFRPTRERLYLLITSLVLAASAYLAWHWFKGAGKPLTVTSIPFDFTNFQANDQLLPLLDSKKQLDFLIHYPGSIFTILIRTLQEQGIHYFESFIGLLGWLDTELSLWIYITYPCALIIAALSSSPTSNHSKTEKTLLISSWTICCGAILVGFYLFSTPVANTIIGGIQGRYFIPIAFPLAMTVTGILTTPKTQKNNILPPLIRNWPIIYTCTVLLSTTYNLWQRFYQ